MLSRLEVSQERADANLREMKEDNNEKFEVFQGTLVARMNMRQAKMDAVIADMKDGRKERTAFHGATEATPEKVETSLEMMQSVGSIKKAPK
jgi:tRNA G10  N-methylase Trm11